MDSAQRAPRVFHSVWQTEKSSGQGLSPTPRLRRSFVRYATEPAILATSMGLRTGSFNTLIRKRTFSVTTPMAEITAKGSRKGVFELQYRAPSSVYG